MDELDVFISESRPTHRGFGLHRGGSSAWLCPLASSLLTEPQKRCPEDIIAVAHDDDLQLIENVVRSYLYRGVMHEFHP